jgi:hypothetical protein
MTLKLFVLAIIFVLTSGAFFSHYFKKNKFLTILAVIIAIVSTLFLFKDILSTLKDDIIASLSTIDKPNKSTGNGFSDSLSGGSSFVNDSIFLESIECINTEDLIGNDDVVLKNGKNEIIWMESMNDGEEKPLNLLYKTSINLSLYEKDASFWGDEDDYLGSKTIEASNHSNKQGSQAIYFDKDGAVYKLNYRIGEK